jgi:membrane-associated phospholipid phosphatase
LLDGVAEILVAAAAYIAYSLSCGAVPAHRGLAFANANRVIALERWARILLEQQIQAPVLPHTSVVQLFNAVYMWGHLPLIVAVLAWLFVTDRPKYRFFRNALLLSGAVGLVIFYSVPLAPPRLVPTLHIVDTAALISPVYDTVEPKVFFNPYAAMPSMHIAWDLLMGIALVWCARVTLARWLGALIPLSMLAAVVVTGNHYLLDGFAGAAVGLLGFGAAGWLQRMAVGHGVTSPIAGGWAAPAGAASGRSAPRRLAVDAFRVATENEHENEAEDESDDVRHVRDPAAAARRHGEET